MMINLLRADIYKLFRNKSIYICSGLSCVFLIMTLFIKYFAYSYIGERDTMINSFPDIFRGNLITLLAIVVSILVSFDFSKGTVKNYISKGFKREEVYVSKFIVSFITFLIFVLVNFLMFCIVSPFLFNFGEFTQSVAIGLFRMIGLEMLAFIAIISVFVFISMLIRSLNGAITVNLCILFFAPIVLSVISAIVSKSLTIKFNLGEYFVLNYPEMLAAYSLANGVVIRSVIVSIVTIAVTTLLGIITFKKRDVV